MFGKNLGCIPDYCTEQLERGMGRKGKREGGWEERGRDPFLFPSFALLFLSSPRRLGGAHVDPGDQLNHVEIGVKLR